MQKIIVKQTLTVDGKICMQKISDRIVVTNTEKIPRAKKFVFPTGDFEMDGAASANIRGRYGTPTK